MYIHIKYKRKTINLLEENIDWSNFLRVNKKALKENMLN